MDDSINIKMGLDDDNNDAATDLAANNASTLSEGLLFRC